MEGVSGVEIDTLFAEDLAPLLPNRVFLPRRRLILARKTMSRYRRGCPVTKKSVFCMEKVPLARENFSPRCDEWPALMCMPAMQVYPVFFWTGRKALP